MELALSGTRPCLFPCICLQPLRISHRESPQYRDGVSNVGRSTCRANAWAQIAVEILGLIALSAFSALRSYALSNRSIWLAAIILLLALPPVVMRIVDCFYLAPEVLPSPLNCSNSSSLPPALSVRLTAIIRGSQLAAELLVAGITWWYTYQSYRIRKGITLGKTISSLLFYTGSMYFLDFSRPCASSGPQHHSQHTSYAANSLEAFVDPLASILTCHFMLSLRQFDSTITSMNDSGLGPRVREHMASTVLEFGA
ncbi:hypothetical protein LXA43DRAFT_637518 [Ganoderma leucocontextum]|nr:hypothetical protein LXA43DRAFT_637518 [Ganoderma leucocontextum]